MDAGATTTDEGTEFRGQENGEAEASETFAKKPSTAKSSRSLSLLSGEVGTMKLLIEALN